MKDAIFEPIGSTPEAPVTPPRWEYREQYVTLVRHWSPSPSLSVDLSTPLPPYPLFSKEETRVFVQHRDIWWLYVIVWVRVSSGSVLQSSGLSARTSSPTSCSMAPPARGRPPPSWRVPDSCTRRRSLTPWCWRWTLLYVLTSRTYSGGLLIWRLIWHLHLNGCTL